MPTYEYACRSCEEHLEVVQSFKDDALTVCESCGGELRKVFSAAGLIFKGSGWHIKDYSSSAKSTTSTSSTSSDTKSDSKSATSSDTKSDTKSSSTGTKASTAPATSTSSSSD
jgi:putative FmdB family regulatory protein